MKFVFPQIRNTKTVILSIFVVTNILVAASRPVAVYSWIKFLEFLFLGVYIVKTKPDTGRVVIFLSIGVLYSSILAIAQFVLQRSVGGIFWLIGERTFSTATPGIAQIPLCLPNAVSCPIFLRSYATFPHPNLLGGFLAVMLPLVMYQLINLPRRQAGLPTKKTTRLKIFYSVTIMLGIIALLLSFSRSAWAAGMLRIGIWYLVSRKKKFAFPHIPYTKTQILVLLFVIILSISIIVPRFLGDSESVVVRNQLNISAISIIEHSPFFGVGLGNFLAALPRFLPSRTIYFLQPAHNIYLLLLSEVGIVGFGLIGWIAFGILRQKTKDKRQEKSGNIFRVVCRVSLVALLLLGLVDHYLLTLQQGRLVLTLFVSLFIIV